MFESCETWSRSKPPAAGLDLGDLVCESITESHAQNLTNKVEPIPFAGGPALQVAHMENVLFVPEHRLQILPGGVVPLEAVMWGEHLTLYQLSNHHRRSIEIATPLPRLEEEVCILANIWCDNFYHYLEQMMKVVILERHGFTGRYVIADLPPFATELLELLGVSRDRIASDTRVPVVFRSALLTTPIRLMIYKNARDHRNILANQHVFFALREALFESVAADKFTLGDRLWLKRERYASSERKIVNMQEVSDVLRRHGVVEVEMSELSVRQQLSAIRHGHLLAGPHGAALVHSMFLPERSAVIECFSPSYINPCVIEICRLLKHRYTQIVYVNTMFSKYAHDKDIYINCSQLELALETLSGGSPAS